MKEFINLRTRTGQLDCIKIGTRRLQILHVMPFTLVVLVACIKGPDSNLLAAASIPLSSLNLYLSSVHPLIQTIKKFFFFLIHKYKLSVLLIDNYLKPNPQTHTLPNPQNKGFAL